MPLPRNSFPGVLYHRLTSKNAMEIFRQGHFCADAFQELWIGSIYFENYSVSTHWSEKPLAWHENASLSSPKNVVLSIIPETIAFDATHHFNHAYIHHLGRNRGDGESSLPFWMRTASSLSRLHACQGTFVA